MSTKIVITRLTCNKTEDWTGPDNCELRISYDDKYDSRRRDMNDGDVWDVNLAIEFQNQTKIELWDIDEPIPFDANDHLGTVVINQSQSQGSAVFTKDNVDYRIDWVPG